MTTKQATAPKGLTIGAVVSVLILTPALMISAFMPTASKVPPPTPPAHSTGFSMEKVSASANLFFEHVGEWAQGIGQEATKR
ncbi:hypothetical protein GCM10025867_48090 (plasmid) [Frondihabitans sucicola]|uniref:Uncharacterized protein n=1 Tax=Frondihabitans sucicola TaxID=1268041 RepID=A0ABN6YAL3_9MICO|nr:hypothetical protein [Frondihabitans sucicola]BDZ52568.1 hypothetical protein GCM10025867_48090 [Frondihabitans sucicola]